MHALTLLTTLLASAHTALAYYPQGTIQAPANGTSIAPGEAFDFLYDIRSDYCTSSFNYTVWMFTSDPKKFKMGADNVFGTGRFLGRYQNENYPAVPYPKNPAPAQLEMPNFAHSQGGFEGGLAGSNKKVYLAVIEEWSPCAGTMGEHLSITWNTLNYNSTKHH